MQLAIKMYPVKIIDPSRFKEGAYITYEATEIYGKPSNYVFVEFDTYQDPAASPFPLFITPEAACNYYAATQCVILMNDVNSFFGYNLYDTYDVEFVEPAVGSAIHAITADTIADGTVYKKILATDAAKIANLATVATSGSYNDLIDKPASTQVNSDWNATTGVSQILNKPTIFSGAYSDLSGKPTLFSGAYSDLSGKPTIPTTFDNLSDGTTNKAYTATEKTKLAGVAIGATANSADAFLLARSNHTGTDSADVLVDGVNNKAYTASERLKLAGITAGATLNLPDATLENRANHTGTQPASTITGLATVATSGSYSDLSNKPTIPTISALSFATPTRTVGTVFQISATRSASVVYSIPVTSNATLVAGSQGSASLKYADDAGMTTNVVTLPGDAFGIASGLLVSGIGSLKMSGIIPAGKYVQITTANISGTPTFGAILAQEVLGQ